MDNLVIDVISSAMLLEVGTLVEYHEDKIIVFFPKGKKAIITTKKLV